MLRVEWQVPQYLNSKENNRPIIAGVVTAKYCEYGFLFCCSVSFRLLWPCGGGVLHLRSMYTGPKFSIYFVQDCSNAARISNANLFFKVGRCCSHHIVK